MIHLTPAEQEKYETIVEITDKGGNKNRVALKLSCSKRHINRMISGYNDQGKAYFSHGNKSLIPFNKIPSADRDAIIKLYQEDCNGANFAHFTELVFRLLGIKVSETTITAILNEAKIISPKSSRSRRKRLTIQWKLESSGKEITSAQDRDISSAFVDIKDAHPRRPRMKNFGEQIQLDASLDPWFGEDLPKVTLLAGIDDCTGNVVGAHFEKEETLHGYYMVFSQILRKYGIPFEFFADNRTVFIYKGLKNPRAEDDTPTQFGYACKQLGVRIRTSSIPQAKGKIERHFQTFQSRLEVELRLAGSLDIDSANEFLETYVPTYNAQFGSEEKLFPSVFSAPLSHEQVNAYLSVLERRVVDGGNCINYHNLRFKLRDENGNNILLRGGTQGLVARTLDEKLFFSYDGTTYSMEEVPNNYVCSKEFDSTAHEVSKPIYIPKSDHPWRLDNFSKFNKLNEGKL
jgi:hypothetical protein